MSDCTNQNCVPVSGCEGCREPRTAMTSPLLTAEELAIPCMDTMTYGEKIAQAQLVKVVKWLFDDCIEHHEKNLWFCHYQCEECMESLHGEEKS